jgi:hypothetical protein
LSLLLVSALAFVSLSLLVILVRRGMRWGATAEEQRAKMVGDDWLDEKARTFVRMTRALSVRSPVAMVWPWMAQLGRGAGWCSWDLLDNGGRPSARHLVSWIPQPEIGDATAVGYLRHMKVGSELVWWLDETSFLGARVRSAMGYYLIPQDGGDSARLVVRIQTDARGLGAPLVRLLFPIMDSIMACRQMVNLKTRAESYGSRTDDPRASETGARDQYQLYEALFASGGQAGVPGKEHAAKHRKQALRDKVL